MSNPLKTHTDNLHDGDFILSPSLTNMLESAHGNGILMLEDYATGESRRYTPADLPGAVAYSSAHQITIKGGHAVLDGLLVDFAGGYSSNTPVTTTISLDDSSYGSALTSGQQCLFVIFVTSDNSGTKKRIGVARSSAGTSFQTTPTSFLNEGGALDVDQTIVLAVVKAVYADNSTTMKIDIQSNSNVYDVRSFIRPSPIYMGRMSTGTVNATSTNSNRINEPEDLDGMFGGGDENGSFNASRLGGIWMGASEVDDDDVLFFSGYQGGTRRTHRLGPNKVLFDNSRSSNVTFQYDDYNFIIINPQSGSLTVNPSTSDAPFPPGHSVFVTNLNSSNTFKFDSTGLNETVEGNSSAIFVYTGSAWKQSISASAASQAASGASGRVQLSDGSSGLTHSDNLTFNNNELTVTGKLTVTGLIDPTGLELTPVSTNPGGTAANTIYIDSDDSLLKLGSSTVITSSAGSSLNFTDLAQTPANFSGAGGKILNVNSGANAVEFTTLSSLLNTDMGGNFTIGNQSDDTATFSGNLVVSGNLTVSGTTTTINTATLNVADNIVVLNSDATGSASANAGIEVERGDDTNVVFQWNETNDRWQFDNPLYVDTTLNVTGTTTVAGLVGSGDLQIDTDTLFVDVSADKVGINQGTPKAPLQISSVGFGEGSATLTSGSNNGSAFTVTLFPTTDFRSAKLLIEVDGEDGSGNRVWEVAEAVAVHDGSGNARITTYGVVQSNTNETIQAAYGVTVNSGNLLLSVTPQVTGVQYDVRVSWQAMAV